MKEPGGRRAKRPIAFTLLLVVLLTFSIGQGGAWVWFLFTQKRHNLELLRNKVKVVAEFLAEISAPAITGGEYFTLYGYARKAVEGADIVSIKVNGADGMVLFSVSSGKAETHMPKSRNPLYVPWIDTMETPVMKDGRKVGSVEVTFSGRGANDNMLGLMTVPPLVEGAMFLVVAVFVYYFFQLRIGGPIGLMREQIEKVTSGDLTVEMPDLGDDEIGVISDGLGFLVEGLRSSIKRLDSISASVSAAIEELRGAFGSTVEMSKRHVGSTLGILESLGAANESMKTIREGTDVLLSFSSESVSSLLEVKATSEEIVTSMETLFRASEYSYSTVMGMSETFRKIAMEVRGVLDSVENTSASVEEIVASVREVERSAKDSSRLAEEVREEAARKGVLVVAEAVNGIQRITDKVKYSAELVGKLDAHSKDVQKILLVIREVTEQTNLLSLNAAILAEKAGEFGKGFAVVADEMRALSGRTAAYTRDISLIVKTIQDGIREVVASIGDATRMVAEGGEIIYRVGETMSAILEISYKSAGMTRNIERATEEQANSLDYVSRAVVEINNMATHVAKEMDAQLENAGYMLERVGDVKQIAEATRKSTEEQATGTGVVSKNIEHTSERVAHINESVMEQQRANDGIISTLDGIRRESAVTVKQMDEVSLMLERLQREIDALRKETGRLFRVS